MYTNGNFSAMLCHPSVDGQQYITKTVLNVNRILNVLFKKAHKIYSERN